MPKVAIVKGDDRKENLKRVLNLLGDDIDTSINKKGFNTLFIKINTVDINFPLACTNPVALEAVVEYFYPKFEYIIIGDNSFCFSNSNPYQYLAKKFNKVKLSNLTEYGSKEIEFEAIKGTSTAKISLLPEKAFTISLSLPKTHDSVVFTGCSKNMVGCIIGHKSLIHGLEFYKRVWLSKVAKSNELTHKNLVKVVANAKPDLAILDGFVGMEGNGPIHGEKVELGLAMCSEDCVALDLLISKLIGFPKVPYLLFCGEAGLGITNLDKIQILKQGFKDLSEISRKFKPHYLYKYQLMDVKGLGIDFRLLLSFLKRYYRIKPKILEMIRK